MIIPFTGFSLPEKGAREDLVIEGWDHMLLESCLSINGFGNLQCSFYLTDINLWQESLENYDSVLKFM